MRLKLSLLVSVMLVSPQPLFRSQTQTFISAKDQSVGSVENALTEDPPSTTGEGFVLPSPHLQEIKVVYVPVPTPIPVQPISRKISKTEPDTSNTQGRPRGTGGETVSYSIPVIQSLARTLCDQTFGTGYFPSLDKIINAESGWRINAQEPHSGAYGLGQSLPASKMASFGSDYLSNPETQLKWLMSYIKGRYGNPDNAWQFHLAHNWY
jgi:hypothetical protein